MDVGNEIKKQVEWVGTDKIVMGLFIIIVLVYVFYMFWQMYNGESFDNSFVTAPIAAQPPYPYVGLGTLSPYQSQFSSTNQGGSNLNSASVSAGGVENLVGSLEAPVIWQISNALDAYQYSQGQMMDAQGTITSTPATSTSTTPAIVPAASTTAATPATQSFANMKGRSGLFLQSYTNPDQRLMSAMLGGN